MKIKFTDFLCSRRDYWVDAVFSFAASEEFLEYYSCCTSFGAVNVDNVADFSVVSALEAAEWMDFLDCLSTFII